MLVLTVTGGEGRVRAQALSPHPEPKVGAMVSEAARRFAIPERWISSVMRTESGFDPAATSPVGAMGLMQLMPQTYAGLRLRYGLGVDPYRPRDNILAGAAYLRQLYDRYGAAGFLAAYNAGPGRYEDHLIAGRALPLETSAYVAKVRLGLGGEAAAIPAPGIRGTARPSLFVSVGGRSVGPDAAFPTPAAVQPTAAGSPLFAALTAREPGQ